MIEHHAEAEENSASVASNESGTSRLFWLKPGDETGTFEHYYGEAGLQFALDRNLPKFPKADRLEILIQSVLSWLIDPGAEFFPDSPTPYPFGETPPMYSQKEMS